MKQRVDNYGLAPLEPQTYDDFNEYGRARNDAIGWPTAKHRTDGPGVFRLILAGLFVVAGCAVIAGFISVTAQLVAWFGRLG